MNTCHDRRGGFTLLELLMVVIIIAILASIALPQFLRVAERARASEALTVLGALRASELRFKAQNEKNLYTTSLKTVDIDIPGFGKAPASTLWTYKVTATGVGSNAEATRKAGTYSGKVIRLDLDDGDLCTSDAVYGLTVGAC